MSDYKKQVEAVLFTLGKFLTVEEISQILRMGSPGIIKEAIEKLKQDYSEKDSALEIIEDEGKYRMHIRGQYIPLVKDLMPNTELDRPTIHTLSIIAWKQPVLQSDIVKVRGNSTYEHVKILEQLGFITREKSGVSKLIRLTPKFYDYFDTNRDSLKEKLTIPEPKEVDVLKGLPEDNV